AISFRYGYFETRVNFSQMRTPGFRFSMWLMPASADKDGKELLMSHAYDASGDNGVEIDIFEYEWIGADASNRLNLAVQGGGAGKVVTNYDMDKLGIKLNEGFHTIGFLWQPDKLVWTLNEHILKTVTDEALIPDVYSYLIFSREMNSGVKSATLDNPGPNDVVERLPYLPRDPGLYARNIWQFKDRINEDKAIIDYVRVWQPPQR
ncbi:MAG: glycoside hydrolase family 16 protein, partial [Granulosicoccus sp.]